MEQENRREPIGATEERTMIAGRSLSLAARACFAMGSALAVAAAAVGWLVPSVSSDVMPAVALAGGVSILGLFFSSMAERARTEAVGGLIAATNELEARRSQGADDLARTARLREIISKELQMEKEKAQGYLDMANVIMAAIAPNGEIEFMNKKGLSVLGIDERAAIGEDFLNTLVSPSDRGWVGSEYQTALGGTGEISPSHEFAVVSPEKGERVVSWSNATIRGTSGEVAALLLCGEDVTDKRRQEERLKLMGRILESIEEGVVVLDRGSRMVWANPATERITGFSCDEGRPFADLYGTHDGAAELEAAIGEANAKGSWKGEVSARGADGRFYPQSLSLSSIRDGGTGVASHTVAVLSDITVKREAEEKILYLANHDTLTGLPNRASFTKRLDSSLFRAKDKGTKLSVLFIDLDHFKKVNDTLGHAAGDKLLIEVSQRLRESLRRTDFISRLGGDEFTVILESSQTPADAEAMAKKVLSSLSNRYDSVGTHEIRVTPSIGICMYPDDGHDAESLMKRSDLAMYQAKSDGRAQLRFFTPEIMSKDIEHLVLENSLRGAIENDLIVLHYQPKHSFKTGEITGFEALSRWFDAERGRMEPSVFIPIAEETGMIVDLGFWALESACSTLASWQRRGFADVTVAVNLSPRQFRDMALVTRLARIIEETGADASRLQLELTETSIMSDAAAASRILSELKKLGVSIAIDDFGTGYSSLSRLKSLPIDCVKIDGEFVRDIPSDQNDMAIARAVISLGGTMGIMVVAEGVETAEQAEFLRENGADEGQGFYFSPAVDEASAFKMLEFQEINGPFPVGGRDGWKSVASCLLEQKAAIDAE